MSSSAYQVLRNKFPQEEYVLIEEVPDDVSGRNRSLDFMVINMWQSRGLAITGIERKSWRGDWLKEIKTPQKQEKHFLHCDYFYLLTDKENVAKLDEIPETWGWYHITDKGVLKTMKSAPKLNPLPIGKGLLCAMLRRAACKDKYTHNDLIRQRIDNARVEGENEASRKREHTLSRASELVKIFDEFKQASGGVDLGYHWNQIKPEKFAAIVNLINKGEIENMKKTLIGLKETAQKTLDRIAESISTLQEDEQINEPPKLIQ